jgi:twitching motility protein PilT
MLYEIAPEDKVKVFEESGDVDFAYEIPGLARYRANFFQQKYGVGAVFREIPSSILTCEQLGLPPIVRRLATLPRGLVLVTGPTGSGKSTTLAAIIHEANQSRKDHILTIEDPIEFVHQSEKAVVNHREVGLHTRSFSAALRGALREDPDIILVGEMRDLETISLAIEASATGHLVFGTLHTTSAAKTVDRVIEVFPVNQQEQIRNTLADGLRAVVAQTLFKRIDKKGRVAALEIMIANPAVRNLIREAKTFQIPSMIQTGKKYGMQSLDDAIMDHLKNKRIAPDDAYNKANDKSKFRPFLKNPPSDFTEV